MDQGDAWSRRRGALCPNCGATNWVDAEYCVSCGTPLPRSRADDDTAEQTVIDITGGRPQIMRPEEVTSSGFPWPERFGTGGFDQRRVIVARGGRRTCLLVNIVFLLLLCCVCFGLWMTVDSIF